VSHDAPERPPHSHRKAFRSSVASERETIAVVTAAGLRETSRRRWVRGLAPVYPPAVAAVVFITANHYVLDAVAGGALGKAALKLSAVESRERAG